MKVTEEKGITLMTLVIMIIIILILASIGVTTGTNTIKEAQYTQFKNELKVLQTKVNELNQSNKIEIGRQLNEEEKNTLDIPAVSSIIYDGKSDEENLKIQKRFRYCNEESLKEDLDLYSIKREYLINIEYRYVICYKGYNYSNKIIYMVNQIEGGVYNVQYQEKNDTTGSFETQYVREGNKWKIEIVNINYNGNIGNWQVNYKHIDDEMWKETNNLSFYVTKDGKYLIEVKHGNDVNLGMQTIIIENNLSNEVESKNINDDFQR